MTTDPMPTAVSTYPDLYGEPLFRARLARDQAVAALDTAEAAHDAEADAWIARLNAWRDQHPEIGVEESVGVAVQLTADYDAWLAAGGGA